MHISIAAATIAATMLVSLRLVPLFLFAPVFGSIKLPGHFRAFTVLGIAFSLTVVLKLDANAIPLDTAGLLSAAVGEILIGAAIAAVIMIGLAAFSFAGRLLDLQMGFGVASLLDLNTQARMPLVGTALSMMAVMMLYLTDGHHMIVRAIAISFEKMPLAKGIASLDFSFLIAFGSALFSFGLVLVAPVILILFLIDVGIAVMSKTMPQMNVFALAISVKVFVGLILLALSVRYMNGIASKIFETMFRVLENIVS